MQVWVSNRLVGHLNVTPRSGAGAYVTHQMPMIAEASLYDPVDFDETVEVDRIEIPIRRKHMVVDRYLLEARKEDAPMMRASLMIPDDAETSIDNGSHQVRFSWRVFAPSVDDYERIFDMPEFEPV